MDSPVVTTNDDATLCKYQAISKGYYKDPFVQHLLSTKVKNASPMKAPEICRGYYARSASIAYIVEQFIATHHDCQIISFGAGYDTLYWRLKSMPETSLFKYVEVDLNQVAIHKIMSIKRHPQLGKLLNNVQLKGENLFSDDYNMISFDLRQADKSRLLKTLVDDCKLNLERPTLCIAECVLIYMTIQESMSLIEWLNKTLTRVSTLNYEQCNMQDRFGEIMATNMSFRHCDLLGVDACKSMETQIDRFKSHGFGHTLGWTLKEIYNKCLLPAEIQRIEAIDHLDERELLDQLLEHYCITVTSTHEIDWIPEQEYWLSKTVRND